MQLDIENEAAEWVSAEVSIEGPAVSTDVLQHTSRIQFVSGPASKFSIRSPDNSGGGWTAQVFVEVVVYSEDRFGNQGPAVAGSFVLRTDSKSLEVQGGGLLEFDERGEGRVTVRSPHAQSLDVWLERTGNSNSKAQQRALMLSTVQSLYFKEADPGKAGATPSPPPTTTKPPKAALARLPRDDGVRKEDRDAAWKPLADEVKEAFMHAWRGYRKYAWGKDELQPLSKKGRDSFGGMGMTILDSLSTMWLMGLDAEFEEAAVFVERDLDFSKCTEEVSVFEVIIRALGGLLGAHSLTRRKLFLERAEELAKLLIPAVSSSSALPWPKWSLALGRGTPSGEPTILAEAGSLQLEFRQLSIETGDPSYRKVADATSAAIQAAGVSGLMPVYLTPPDHNPPRPLASKFAIGALADSYYEYLLKQWLQSPGEVSWKDRWIEAMDEMPALVRPKNLSELSAGAARAAKSPAMASASAPPRFKVMQMSSNGDMVWTMDHLSCFMPGMLALGLANLPDEDLKDRNETWWRLAEGLTESCVGLWAFSKSGLSPEFATVNSKPPFDFKEVPPQGRYSFLRPETAESLFYLYRFTGDERYRRWGRDIFRAIQQHAKVDVGYASVKNVNKVPTEKLDEMQSFVFAETFKYLFLLFSPADALDLDKYVLNTEGHPLRRPER